MKKTVASCIISFLNNVTCIYLCFTETGFIAIFNILANILEKSTNLFIRFKIENYCLRNSQGCIFMQTLHLKTSTKDEPVQHIFRVRDPEKNECKMKILLSINFNFCFGCLLRFFRVPTTYILVEK